MILTKGPRRLFLDENHINVDRKQPLCSLDSQTKTITTCNGGVCHLLPIKKNGWFSSSPSSNQFHVSIKGSTTIKYIHVISTLIISTHDLTKLVFETKMTQFKKMWDKINVF